jgi:uncharacterized membrane protein
MDFRDRMTRIFRSSLRVWLWLLALLAAVALASLIPPEQSPDEHSHLGRAYMISKGQWLLASPSGTSSGGMIDTSLWAFFDINGYVAGAPTARLTDKWKAQSAALRWGGPEIFYQAPGTGYYVPLIYAPQALGLWLGRTLDLSIAHSYQLVRATCLLTCMGLLAFAFQPVRPPVLAIALLLLPMTVFQTVSPTLDGITNCLAVLALSLFFRMLLAKEDSVAQAWILASSVALLASGKVNLLPLLALPFYLAWARRSRRDAIAGAAALLASLAWTAYALAHTVDTRTPHVHSTAELLLRYVAHPIAFVQIVAKSLADPIISDFYSRSFIGILGWLDAPLPPWSYQYLWIGLGLCAAASLLSVKPGEALLARIGLVIAALACVGLVFLAMLVTWTRETADVVQGVQGRYFIVPAITVAYSIGATLSPWGARAWRWPGWLALCATAGLSFYALIVTILARYH